MEHTVNSILLVDDDADDRDFFQEGLRQIDPATACITAKDGKRALELLRDPGFLLPSYIFLDLRMPRINGKQCLIQLKSHGRLRFIPVIIYSTSQELKGIQRFKRPGRC